MNSSSEVHPPGLPRIAASIRLQRATLICLTTFLVSGAVVVAWFAGETHITWLFNSLHDLQQHPPAWTQVPTAPKSYLMAPALILMALAYGLTRVSVRPKRWNRTIVVAILLTLILRYTLWRSLSTLNLSDPVNGMFSLGLWGMELVGLTGSIIQLLLLLGVRERWRQANQLEMDVCTGQYCPTVDVFIPTYDEPAFILRRTIMGCQAMDYPSKTVYLLDDTRRPEIKALAAELGCEYITRPNNLHAKAGNLNHAILHTQGELIASFDADFVPTRNFLCRTVGFFQAPQVGLVQTPQSFYNADPIARNLGLEDVLTPEEEVFYRQIQPMRDGSGSVVCSGTSFVVRRQALESTGGFVTESISEDYFTAVRLAAQGNEVIYLDEKLSAGLAAENIAAHATQRIRWARGTLQAFFIESNPLTIPGLSLMQRLGHLEGLLHWFSSIPRVYFLLMPLLYSFLGIIPISATVPEVLYFFLPYYLVQLTVFAWLNHRSRSALLSDIYSLVLAFPLAITVLQVMVNPFAKGFKVTPKGTSTRRAKFNWSLGWPLVMLFILTAVSLWRNWHLYLLASHQDDALQGLSLGWIWSGYNLLMLGVALLILLDIPRPDAAVWFSLRRVVKLTMWLPDGRSQDLWGITTLLSETGAQLTLTQDIDAGWVDHSRTAVDVWIAEDNLCLQATVQDVGLSEELPWMRVQFEDLPQAQHRALVEMLFCRPGQWKRWDSPGELRSLWLLLRVFLRPRILKRDFQTKGLPIAQA